MNLAKYTTSPFVKAADLGTREAPVQIEAVRIVELDDAEKICLRFHGKNKELLLNNTNASLCLDAFGPQSEDWIGRRIVLYTARVMFKGSIVDAIRVRIPGQPEHPPRQPAPPPPQAQATTAAAEDDMPF